ncbi:MAG TPA: hypothetical protein VM889_08170 [Candidatus Thermoplasmatota archaeon]|nr:hypothetical protein [Candidatus Thermoplasmatota archaeon]
MGALAYEHETRETHEKPRDLSHREALVLLGSAVVFVFAAPLLLLAAIPWMTWKRFTR